MHKVGCRILLVSIIASGGNRGSAPRNETLEAGQQSYFQQAVEDSHLERWDQGVYGSSAQKLL